MKQDNEVVRISFLTVSVLGLIMVILSVAAGFVGAYLAPARVVVNPGQGSGTVIETVTSGEGVDVAGLVEDKERSVLALGEAAAGAVVTSDGLVVSRLEELPTSAVARDMTGREVVLDRVGTDELYGLTWWSMRDAVSVPLDIRGPTATPGEPLIALSRDGETGLVAAMNWNVGEEAVPERAGAGVQRVIVGPAATDGVLLDQMGSLAGVIVNPLAGEAVPADIIRESLRRVTTGQREDNVFDRLGMQTEFDFDFQPERQLVARVVRATPRGQAQAGGLQAGDLIISVAGEALSFDQLFTQQLSEADPLVVTVRRGEAELDLNLSGT